MIIGAWRIVQMRRVQTAFDGNGASISPGRWNHRGTGVVYTAGSLSLAALEILANVSDEQLSQPFAAIQVALNDNFVKRIEVAALPSNWSIYPPPAATRDLGTEWARGLESAVLAVPSAIVPVENNYLLNPMHPDFGKIAVGKCEAFSFDQRLIRP
jgi:RES domain-containing protein